MKQKISFNSIAPSYNERYEKNSLEGIRSHLNESIESARANIIAEIGCGTGYWTNLLNKSGRILIGIDPSSSMLKIARNNFVQMNLIKGKAEQIPLKNNSVDFLFVVNALHLFTNPIFFFKEASRLITKNGIIDIIFADINHTDYYWYIYNFFKSAKTFDLERLPVENEVIHKLSEAGFKILDSKIVDITESYYKGKDVLSDVFLKKNNSSTLAALTPAEYNAGVELIKSKIKHSPDFIFRSNIFFRSIKAKNAGHSFNSE